MTQAANLELRNQKSILSTAPNLMLREMPNSSIVIASHFRWVILIQLRESLRNANHKQSEVREGLELIPLPPKSKCPICGEPVTMIREILLARNTWEILKPLEPNIDTINVERHLSAQFELLAPRSETGMPFQDYLSILGSSKATDATSSSPPEYKAAQWSSSPDRSRSLSINQALVSPNSPGFRRGLDTPRTEFAPSEDFTSSDGVGYIDTPRTADTKPSIEGLVVPSSPDNTLARGGSQTRLQSVSTVSFGEAETLSRSRTVPLVTPPEKGKSKWGSFSKLTTSRREAPKPEPSGNSSSLSSTTLESQKLEEIQLKSLVNASKATMRGKGAKNINVSLSQNSTYALFWTQASINIWDFGTSSPILGRAVLTESNCVLAAVTKVHLAYIIGTRDQKLTVSAHHDTNRKANSAAPNRESYPNSTAGHRIPHAILAMVSQYLHQSQGELRSSWVRRFHSPLLQTRKITRTARRSSTSIP